MHDRLVISLLQQHNIVSEDGDSDNSFKSICEQVRLRKTRLVTHDKSLWLERHQMNIAVYGEVTGGETSGLSRLLHNNELPTVVAPMPVPTGVTYEVGYGLPQDAVEKTLRITGGFSQLGPIETVKELSEPEAEGILGEILVVHHMWYLLPSSNRHIEVEGESYRWETVDIAELKKPYWLPPLRPRRRRKC